MSMPPSGERVFKWMLAQRVHSGQVNAMALRANVIPGDGCVSGSLKLDRSGRL